LIQFMTGIQNKKMFLLRPLTLFVRMLSKVITALFLLMDKLVQVKPSQLVE
jgi:hypothetical protein